MRTIRSPFTAIMRARPPGRKRAARPRTAVQRRLSRKASHSPPRPPALRRAPCPPPRRHAQPKPTTNATFSAMFAPVSPNCRNSALRVWPRPMNQPSRRNWPARRVRSRCGWRNSCAPGSRRRPGVHQREGQPFQRRLQQDQQHGPPRPARSAAPGERGNRLAAVPCPGACAVRPDVPMRRKPKAQNSREKMVAPMATAPMRCASPSWPMTAVLSGRAAAS